MAHPVIDRTGQKYGFLTVLERAKGKSAHAAYWLCECECGKRTIVISTSLKNGGTKSCGCKKLFNVKNWNRKGGLSLTAEGNAELLFVNYQRNAFNAERNFNLSLEQFKELTSQNCHYCGRQPQTKTKCSPRGVPYVYNGLDRKDNSIGYEPHNCLPCCSVCNRAKNNMAYEDFLLWLDAVSRFQKSTPIEIV